MGNSQSIFYPDNEKRLRRGQELANDCRYAKQQYDASKAKIEEVLGPYNDKLDQLLRAFGCRNIDELDKLVVNSATGQSLEYWNKVRRNYDSSSSVDQVIMGAQAVVILAGLSIGTAGNLTGGLGFFTSLGSAGEVLLVITLIGAIYAVIDGSIQCNKLREAIAQSVVTRLKVKYAQRQMDYLETTVPGIMFLYQTYEELGYNKEKILNRFKDRNCLEDFKAEVATITYITVGQELLEMDSRRDSWTNEDPEWRLIAATLDRALARESTSVVDKPAMLMLGAPVAGIANASVPDGTLELSDLPCSLARFSTSDVTAPNNEAPIGRVNDGEIMMKLLDNDIAPLLSGTFLVKLRKFGSKDSAEVLLNSQDGSQTLMPDLANQKVNWVPSDNCLNEWTLRFVNPTDALDFATTGARALKTPPEKVKIYICMGNSYLTKTGALSTDSQDPSDVFVASYA